MTPSSQELAAGRMAYECIGKFQRSSSPLDMALFFLVIAGGSLWRAYTKDGWQAALGLGLFWAVMIAISIYQIQRLKKQAGEATTLLTTLKATYGEGIYSEIKKGPHSLYYYLILKRYPPFNQKSIELP